MIICESTFHSYYLLHIYILVTANDVSLYLTLLISTISINKKTMKNLRALIIPWLNEKHIHHGKRMFSYPVELTILLNDLIVTLCLMVSLVWDWLFWRAEPMHSCWHDLLFLFVFYNLLFFFLPWVDCVGLWSPDWSSVLTSISSSLPLRTQF